jgi:hypothetical protein
MTAAKVGEGPDWAELTAIDGVGDVLATSVVMTFQQEPAERAGHRCACGASAGARPVAAARPGGQPGSGKDRGLHRHAGSG